MIKFSLKASTLGPTIITVKAVKSFSSILLHSCLNPAWQLWLLTRYSCCMKIRSVDIICIQVCRFLRGFKPQENLSNSSRKYPKMFKTDFIFRQQKIEFKPECQAWSYYYATGWFVAFFRWFFYTEMRPKYEKNILLASSRAFFCCPTLWKK